MSIKTLKNIFLFLAITLIVILFSPLDYLYIGDTFFHFWLTIISGILFLISFAKEKENRKKRIIASIVLLPFVAFFSFYIYVVSPNGDVEINHVPKSKLIVTSQFYTLFMMGDPMYEISIGYPIFGNILIWRTNSYTKKGLGESNQYLSKYKLPKDLDLTNYEGVGIFILTEENYLFDWANDTIYPIKKK